MLVPVLVDRQRCDAATTEAVKNMMLMNPPTAFSVRPVTARFSVSVQRRPRVIPGVCLSRVQNAYCAQRSAAWCVSSTCKAQQRRLRIAVGAAMTPRMLRSQTVGSSLFQPLPYAHLPSQGHSYACEATQVTLIHRQHLY